MTAAQPTFDADLYKETTRKQWQSAAEAWNRWGSLLEAWLGEATAVMCDLAQLEPGDRVVDLAAGAGGQSLAAARRVGPSGSVVATDISSNILAFVLRNAEHEGLRNVRTVVADGEDLPFEAGSFDAAITRLGLIYFPNRQAALCETARVLVPGGRLSAVVYTTADRNAFFSIPVSVIRERAKLPPPLPGQPGPFSLGAAGVLESAYLDAGFRDVEVRTIPAPVRMASAQECVRFEQESFGALHQMLAGLPESERASVWDEIHERLRAFETADGFVGPCELLVAAATA
ncbi:MAG TPA: methyltransferase domain-containing protein [Candidatus Binatia bacterium]|nr:methyltransferase domain-containing protein [Candidatus Binatia bacterium]